MEGTGKDETETNEEGKKGGGSGRNGKNESKRSEREKGRERLLSDPWETSLARSRFSLLGRVGLPYGVAPKYQFLYKKWKRNKCTAFCGKDGRV